MAPERGRGQWAQSVEEVPQGRIRSYDQNKMDAGWVKQQMF